jgi:hypothetical protein
MSTVPGSLPAPAPGLPPDPGFGYPVYPSGEPLPIRPNGLPPANELPMPNIPPTTLPMMPAQPVPAIPGTTSLPSPSARTTGEHRPSK